MGQSYNACFGHIVTQNKKVLLFYKITNDKHKHFIHTGIIRFAHMGQYSFWHTSPKTTPTETKLDTPLPSYKWCDR